MSVAAVILAAGAGRRFISPTASTDSTAAAAASTASTGSTDLTGAPSGAHKLLSPFRGRPLFSWAIAAALEAGLDETIVMTGAVSLSEVMPEGVTVIHNEQWQRGMATSLAGAIAYAASPGRDHEAVVVGLGDQPFISAAAYTALAHETGTPIAVATYDGQRGNPVLLHRDVWPLLPLDGDAGARELIRRRPDLVREVPCPGSGADIDTREDVERWS